jgi:hypothetical protein
MRIMKKVILIIVAVVVVLLVSVYAYYGGFKKINFRVEEQGGETLVYENVVGDYSQASAVMNELYYSLRDDEKIEATKGLGIYYDNPKNVDKSELRSEVGNIVENLDSTAIAQLALKYQVKTLPESAYIVTEFPFKGSLSILLGVMKVYPALEKYVEKEGFKYSPVTEIYDIPNKKIIYRKEVVK